MRSAHSRLSSAIILVLLLGGPALANRSEIRAVLDRMETAVLAGDGDAYMQHVATDDPVFTREQVNWARDLSLHVPIAFSLEIGDPIGPTDPTPRPEFRLDVATFDLRTAWTLAPDAESGRGQLQREVQFPVSFRRVRDGAGGRWVYAGERWVGVERNGNVALCFPGFESVAEMVIDVMPGVREHVSDGFEFDSDHQQSVKIYPRMDHLQHSIYLSYTDALSGWNEPGESIKVLVSRPRNQGADQMRMLLAHEFGHVATFAMGPDSNEIAWWILEGVAELAAEKYMAQGLDAKMFVEDAVRRNALVDWSLLTDFRTVKPEHSTHVYKQGHHMIGFISERFGREERNRWLRALANGATLDEASTDALGMDFIGLDTLWRESIGAGVATPDTVSQ